MNRLTAEIFEEIIASLRSDRSVRSNEKRTKPRVGLRSSLEIHPCAPNANIGATVVVSVRDLSAEGLGFICTRSLPAGMEFIADFQRWEREQLRVKYRVAYCKMISRGMYSVGARLDRVLSASSKSATKPATARASN
ncbi:hypothetical protein BH09PLA1_BH09PLA1_12360 [soil metagenome]